jgi:hypothetical protein
MKMLSKQNPLRKRPARLFLGLTFLLVLILPFLPLEKGSAGDKMTIGEVEDVILMPWGLRLPARIDTGAATSSLDARELIVKDKTAEFRLPKMYGGLRLSLPVIGWQKIRSAEFRERRPVVEITFCIGPKLVRAQVTLNNRATVTYPLIIGRNVLKDQFVVDCMKSNCLPPTCKEALSK